MPEPSAKRVVLVAAVALLAAACSSGDDEGAATDTEPAAAEPGTADEASPEATPEPEPTQTPTPEPEPEPLVVLVTNDDGVGSEGISAVVELLSTIPDIELHVVAPSENQSGTGDRQSNEPPSAAEATTASGFPAIGVDGTPADSVIHALEVIGLEPDLVVSGANEGQNIGVFVGVSGTVGAAKTAVRQGIPALALSADNENPDYAVAAEYATAFVLQNEALLREGNAELTVTAVNIPTCPDGGQLGELTVPIADDFGGIDPFAVDCASGNAEPANDVEAFTSGYIAVSVLEVEPDPLDVRTDLGDVRGIDAGSGVHAWLTVPYAAPPVGDNRFRVPQEHPGWETRLRATEPGLSCPQPEDELISSFTPTPPSDEDCLTLSVWSPRDAEAPLPVMVWIHGGGFTTGSAHQPLYDGVDLSSEGVVVVNVNYRLGPLGFLATEALQAEDPRGAVGNLGIADQTFALEWVQRNIAGFGGDPENVTIFGESAGGFSVCALLAAPSGRELFDKAIIQSGGGCTRLADLDTAFTAGAEWAESLGCADADQVACLRALPVDDLIAAGADGFGLVADGVRLTTPAYEQTGTGALDDIPVLIGSNLDEMTLFTIGLDPDLDLLEAAEELAGELAPELAALYPPDDHADGLSAFQAMATDLTFACPALAFADVLADRGPTYSYEFVYVPDPDPFGLGATHGAELVFLFSNPEGIVGLGEPDETSLGVSDAVQRAWVAFATDGAPIAAIDWPATAAGDPTIMLIDEELAVTDEIRAGRCAEITALGLIP